MSRVLGLPLRSGGSYGDETLFVARADGTGQRRISKLGVTCCPWALDSRGRSTGTAFGPTIRRSPAFLHAGAVRRLAGALPGVTAMRHVIAAAIAGGLTAASQQPQ
jgi:hypothetical protein